MPHLDWLKRERKLKARDMARQLIAAQRARGLPLAERLRRCEVAAKIIFGSTRGST